jgi:hypothetical protein
MRLKIGRGNLTGLGTPVTAPNLTPSQASVVQLIDSAAASYPTVPGLANVAVAVASHESQFDPNAQNPGSSAAGVMQLLSSAQTYTGVTNPYDVGQNVNAGVGLLAGYYQQYGNWAQALQAYADGPGTVAAGLPPSQTAQDLINYSNQYDSGAALEQAGVLTGGGGGGSEFDTSGELASTDMGTGTGTGVDWTTVGIVGAALAAAVILS